MRGRTRKSGELGKDAKPHKQEFEVILRRKMERETLMEQTDTIIVRVLMQEEVEVALNLMPMTDAAVAAARAMASRKSSLRS